MPALETSANTSVKARHEARLTIMQRLVVLLFRSALLWYSCRNTKPTTCTSKARQNVKTCLISSTERTTMMTKARVSPKMMPSQPRLRCIRPIVVATFKTPSARMMSVKRPILLTRWVSLKLKTLQTHDTAIMDTNSNAAITYQAR